MHAKFLPEFRCNCRREDFQEQIMNEEEQISEFLTIFDAKGLGEGDLIAGANTLVAMAVSLANIARPGSALKDKQEPDIQSGNQPSDLWIPQPEPGRRPRGDRTGPATTPPEFLHAPGSGRDRGICQNARQLPALAAWPTEPTRPRTRRVHAGGVANRGSTLFHDSERHAALGALSEQPIRPRIEEWLKQSRFFLTGRRPEEIERQLESAHLGNPLIYLGIDEAADFDRFGDLAAAVIDGRATAGPMVKAFKEIWLSPTLRPPGRSPSEGR